MVNDGIIAVFSVFSKNRYYPVEYIKKGHDTNDTKADKA